ncbi:MAG: chemotaxis protein CheA [Nitrospinota bacterium]|nr:chemotaxis protein CheA [Nitrospinota bacterium]
MSKNSEKEIFDAFLSEASEFVSDLERDVINLERDPTSKSAIDNIFRSLHSLKGNSSLFGLSEMKLFLHQMESLVDKIRKREREVTTHIINLLLEGNDHIKMMFSRLTDSSAKGSLTGKEESFLEQVSSVLSPEESGAGADLRKELMIFMRHPEIQLELQTNQPLKDIFTLIQDVAPHLLADRRASKTEAITILCKGVDVTREITNLETIVKEVNEGNLSDQQYSAVTTNLDFLLKKHEEKGQEEQIQLINDLLEELEMFYHDESGFDEVLAQIVEEALAKYEQGVMRVKPEVRAETEAAPTTEPDSESGPELAVPKPERPEPAEPSLSRQIKVDQSKLDKAIDTAGELVTISEFFNYIQNSIAGGNGDLKGQLNSIRDATQTLQELTESLSSDLYDIRKVPIGEAFQKLPRIIRDEQKSLGKKVWLSLSGEEEMVDKSLVPKLETILVHMLRNSMDHGIETPEERLASKKSEEGLISIAATAGDTMMNISVKDNGRGIDPEKVKMKAIKAGLLDSVTGGTLTKNEILNYIFVPGFSTSSTITETSGRGVGMDIVHSYITEMGGNITINTEIGKGLEIILRFPLTQTTLVKKGLAISVGKSVFLIPIELVIESFRLKPGEISSVEGKAEIIRRRGEILKLVRLHQLFKVKSDHTDPYESIIVLVQQKRRRVCLMVDMVIGQRQIIYKNLGLETLRKPSPYEGVSVYDGSRLAMILDINGIIEQSEQ